MIFPRFFLLSLLIFSTFTFTFAQIESPTESQTEKTEEREKLEKQAIRLTEQALGEATSLKLWENRALAFAMAGDLLWDSNQKRAKALFRDSADELIRGAIQPKKKSNNYFDEEYFFWADRSPRRTILLMIASHDADMALRFLQETRPPKLQQAIDEKDRPGVKGQKRTSVQIQKDQANKFRINQEISLEQQFATKAAEQDPQKAAKLIRESLKKGVSMSAINLIQKVQKKDEDLSKELFGEIIDKLLSVKLEATNQEFQIANYLINQSINPELLKSRNPKFEKIKVEENDLKDLVDKVADYYLSSKGYNNFWGFSSMLPAFQKYSPTKVDALKQRQKKALESMPEQMKGFMESANKLTDPNATAEDLMNDAKNQTTWQKEQTYKLAIDKFLDKGEGEKALSLLKSESESIQKTNALNYLSKKQSDKAIKNGKLEEVEKLIDGAETKSSKIQLLVDLAIGFEKKKTEEDHKTAVNLMEEASGIINDIPQSFEEAGDILKIASGYALIEPKRSYEYMNNLIYMANDVITASALLAKYNKRSSTIKDGEVIFTQIFSSSYVKYGEALSKLSEHDFGKTESVVGQFQRQDLQILTKFILAQSILKDKIGLEGNRPFIVFGNF